MYLLFLLLMQPNLEILRTSDPQISELIQNAISEETCDFNQAKIYHLSDGRYLMRPKVMGKYVLLYNNRELMDQHIKKKYFPINDFEVNKILESEKETIIFIGDSIDLYVNYIQRKFKLEDLPLERSTLKVLNEKVKDYGFENLSEYDIFSLGMYVNEIFRIETSTNWHNIKIYTLNTYFYPLLITKSGKKFDVARLVYEFIREFKIYDFELCYKIEYNKFTGNQPIILRND